MYIKLTASGEELAKRQFTDGLKVIEITEVPIVGKDVWSFSNDLIQFLGFNPPVGNQRSFRSICIVIWRLMNDAHYGCDAYAIERAIEHLISRGYIQLFRGTETVETSELVDILTLIAAYDRMVILRRLIREPMTGTQLSIELRHSQAHMSNSLRALERAGLLTRIRSGHDIVFRTNIDSVTAFIASLFSYFLEEGVTDVDPGSARVGRDSAAPSVIE